jgi:RNA polymerase sigma-54 factor
MLGTHLLAQLHSMTLPPMELALCERIIGNLDDRGFHVDPPEVLLDSENPLETPQLLAKCLDVVRCLDPIGTACTGSMESLFIQAKIDGKAPPLAFFFLQGHLDLLQSKNIAAIKRIIKDTTEDKEEPGASYGKVTAAAVTRAIEYIRTLDPFPARGFGGAGLFDAAYIIPDVYVRRRPPEDGPGFTLDFDRQSLPEVTIAPSFADLDTMSAKIVDSFSREMVRSAKWVIDAVRQRHDTIVKTMRVLVDVQYPFFDQGPLFLQPLRMKDVAKRVGVHETTISRLSRGKYVQCEWGLFELRRFFSNVVGEQWSKEGVKQQLASLIGTYHRENPSKKLSDQMLCDRLAAMNITVARRTVAKYRNELGYS